MKLKRSRQCHLKAHKKPAAKEPAKKWNLQLEETVQDFVKSIA